MEPEKVTIGDRKMILLEQNDLLKFLADEGRKSVIDSDDFEHINI